MPCLQHRPLRNPSQPGYPPQQAAPNPTSSPVWLGSTLLCAMGAEGSSLKPDFLGSGQRSMTVCHASWQDLAAVEALRWLASLRGLMASPWAGGKEEPLCLQAASPAAETAEPGSGCARARVLPPSLARARQRAQDILKVTATE